MGCCDKGRVYREASKLELDLVQARAQKEISGLDKLVKAAGCPAGQHKHAPYDYCHPTDRAHRGYTDEEPAGGLEAAHGVLDAAIVEARSAGAAGVADLLGSAKKLLDPKRRNPAGAAIALSKLADTLLDTANRYKKSPNMHIRAKSMPLKSVEKVIRSAAKKVAEEKPKMGGRQTPGEEGEAAGRREAGEGPAKADADIKGMDDKSLLKYHDDLMRAWKQAATGDPKSPGHAVMSENEQNWYYERARDITREIKERGLKGGGEAQTGHPERGKKVLNELKGKMKEVDKRAKNAPPGSRARARAQASLQSLKEIEKKVRAQMERQRRN